MRALQARLGPLAAPDGSAYYAHGNTRVIAAVYGPHEVTMRSKAHHDRVLINCEFAFAPFSMTERRKRGKTDKCDASGYPLGFTHAVTDSRRRSGSSWKRRSRRQSWGSCFRARKLIFSSKCCSQTEVCCANVGNI